MQHTKGILIICVGSSLELRDNYRRWAYNFVASVKRFTNLPIQVLYDGDPPEFGDIHTNVTGICEKAQFEPAELKLRLNHYTVFDQTLYLDVDGVCLKNPEPLFDECETFNTQLTGTISRTEGQKNMLWAKQKTIWEKYSLPPDAVLPASNTSFIYFDKSADHIFDKAYEIYQTNPLRVEEMYSKWGRSHSQPDEFFINLSLYLNGFDPKNVRPIYFKTVVDTSKYIGLDEVRKSFYFIGCFGGTGYNHSIIAEFYDLEMREIFKPYPVKYKYHRLISGKFYSKQKPNYENKNAKTN